MWLPGGESWSRTGHHFLETEGTLTWNSAFGEWFVFFFSILLFTEQHWCLTHRGFYLNLLYFGIRCCVTPLALILRLRTLCRKSTLKSTSLWSLPGRYTISSKVSNGVFFIIAVCFGAFLCSLCLHLLLVHGTDHNYDMLYLSACRGKQRLWKYQMTGSFLFSWVYSSGGLFNNSVISFLIVFNTISQNLFVLSIIL